MSIESAHDPRSALVKTKYFSLHPKPLERWLWKQALPPAAERVFWLHWEAGMQRGDWCSEIPLKRVAVECCVDPSTVTRAYQVLKALGLIRREDPGRDPNNPFCQATAVTEVRLPRDLLVELDRHPSRQARPSLTVTEPASQGPSAQPTTPAAPVEPNTPLAAKPQDPFLGLRAAERRRALSELEHAMSAAEQHAYREALRTHSPHMSFDDDSKVCAEARGRLLQFLSVVAAQPRNEPPISTPMAPKSAHPRPRKLSVFELARLNRDIQKLTTCAAAPDLVRQVIWSIEEGALQRFAIPHAIHIAIKKLREGSWTRPNRMPPNWMRSISAPSTLETCRRA
jgi:hypothetical protein